MVIVVFVFLMFSAGLTIAKQACSVIPTSDLSNSSKEILKTVNLDYAQTKMPEMCRRNLMLRYLNSIDQAPPNCETWPLEKLEAFVDKNIRVADQWNLSLLSTPNTREASFKSYYNWDKSCSDCPDPHDFQNLEKVERFFSVPKKENTERALAILQKMQNSNSMEAKSPSLNDEATKAIFCVKEAIFRIITCVKGLDLIAAKTKVIHPAGYGLTFSNIDLWKKIYSSNKYDEGLRLVALKIADRVKNKIPAKANIFDDLQESFLASGLGKADAREAAIDTLGLVSNGGPNTLRRAVKVGLEYSQKSLALGFIGNALAYLDIKKQESSGSLYSYPSDVVAKCDNAKPYHFWMAAYLGKELKKSGFSDEDAESTVYLANQGYHLKRDIGYVQRNTSGDPTPQGPSKNAILTRSPFDPAHQIARTDLAYAAAGAVFGARDGKLAVNVDNIILKLIENASVETPLSKQEALALSIPESYLRWSKIFSPGTALDAARGK